MEIENTQRAGIRISCQHSEQMGTDFNGRKVEGMIVINREDFYELAELRKIIDLDNIPYEKLMSVFVGFICDELISNENLQKLNIDIKTGATITRFALQGKAFLEEQITQEELLKDRISAWRIYKGLADKSKPQNLIRIVVCCLYDRKSSEFDKCGSEEELGLYFNLLRDLGPGSCKQFRCYIQNSLIH